jgi:enolase 1/2/3
MSSIQALRASEILDSRGNPTLWVTVTLTDGIEGSAGVPSGASTGTREAVELRDGDPARFAGKGVRKAAANVEGEIARLLVGRDPRDQARIDRDLIDLDGTPTKARLGANAILGVSMAVARAAASAASVPLHRYLGGDEAVLLPVPMMNVLNGGKHADNGIDFQEYMLAPIGAPTFAEALRWGAETYAKLKSLIHERGFHTAVGDEGGFAPALASNEMPCALIVEAIERAGYRPGEEIAIAIDAAASSFCTSGKYALSGAEEGIYDSRGMLNLYRTWTARYPIISIEDGFAEDDWEGFCLQVREMGERVQIVGDDLFVTNPRLIREGIAKRAANAALIKLNQIGTLTETLEAIATCHSAGWRTMISHRSGETPDDFIADLAVAVGAGQMKSGAPARGERVAKYNRLLQIERELGPKARFGESAYRSAQSSDSTTAKMLVTAEQSARDSSPVGYTGSLSLARSSFLATFSSVDLGSESTM